MESYVTGNDKLGMTAGTTYEVGSTTHVSQSFIRTAFKFL